jgi:putative ABC transport system permease protein
LDGKIKALGYWPDSRIQEVQKLQQVTELLEYFALVLAIISLISSVIGIFITMMSMISARKTEIGLMKAIGATDELIMNVFMGEAVLIGLMGGVVGIVISAFFAWLSNDLLRPSLQPGAIVFSGMDFKDLSISIPLWLAVASPLLAALASLFAGYIPARRAARVDPIDALRSAE